MDVREKLVELIEQSGACFDCFPVVGYEKEEIEKIASHLIANGVTVQEWISVTERLPELNKEEIESCRIFGDTFFPEFNVMILGATRSTTLYYDGKRWYDEGNRCYCVTHWCEMPKPPKGE